MTIKSSASPNPPLSFQEIEEEFGQNPGRSLGRYRTSHPDFGNKNLGELTNLPLDTGIPTTGEIKYSDFYGKRANIVVDLHSSGNTNFDLDVYANRFANGNYNIVGDYRTTVTKSQWQGGKKVIIHINKTFGSVGASDKNDVAVKTGNTNNNVNQAGWPSDTTFAIDVGSNGIVAGKGGNGGDTGNEESPGENGGNGSSAMKLINSAMQNVVSIASGGAIVAGGGGGGSGSGSEQNDSFAFWSDRNSASGGGGGGGAGIPAGSGGSTGGVAGATAGQPGKPDSEEPNTFAGGAGGNGGDNEEAEGGVGGDGGGPGQDGGNATGGKSKAGPNGNGGEGGEQYLFY